MSKYRLMVVCFFALFTSMITQAETLRIGPCDSKNTRVLTLHPSVNDSATKKIKAWSNQNKQWGIVASADVLSDKSRAEVLGGKLVSLTSCVEDGCSGETVVWVPKYVCRSERSASNVEEMLKPIEAKGRDDIVVERYQVEPVGPVEYQIVQSNINLVLQALHRIGANKAPEMEKPPYADPHKASLDETIRFNTYYFYEKARTGQLPDVDGTGFEGGGR